MNIKLIAAGKIKEKFLQDGINEFLKRMHPYASVEIIELPALRTLEAEARKILSLIKPASFVVTLEVNGKMFSSEEFAAKIEEIANSGISEMIFIIGSSCGIAASVSQRADLKMSMSKMTFLHQFARLILVEQIYRAFKIISRETYHK
ncbi:MAG: 23S rRNA (pseudouridine(1915)-N(3))-methyltransferase RlmH [Heliobacteriaceae bacterium]|jgi:23S rRNA (pseudouridine1915-N3)-methyltransferase|nr:23S rRNA (pseudouridine(1915)-N(3))-methyltransferase RlmH [Heliobacteriaceae bacterium]